MTETSYAAVMPAQTSPGWSRLVMYVGAGSIGTLAHFGILFAVLESLGPVAASSVGAVVGCIVNYCLAREIVFRSSAPFEQSFPRFIAVAITGIAVNALAMSALVLFSPILISQLIASGIVLLLGYVANKRWTFDDV